MKPETIESIKMLAAADPESSPETVAKIVADCKNTHPKRRATLTARQVCDALQISRPTLHRLCKTKRLSEVKITPRKYRYFADEVDAIASTAEA